MSNDILNAPLIAKDHETDSLDPFTGQILTHSSKRFIGDQILDEIYLEAREENSRLPSPYALMTNRVSEHQLENGMPVRDLHHNEYLFNMKYPEDYIIAYNSPFDFKFTFCGYYQNLICADWYAWKTRNKLFCGYEIMKTLFGIKKDLEFINIPYNRLDIPSFRLENIIRENNFDYSPHNASEDVSALISLFNLMRYESPEIVRQAMLCSSKKFVKGLIEENLFFCTVMGFTDDICGKIIAPICYSPDGNHILGFDISLVNPEELISISSWDIFTQIQKRYDIDNIFVKIPINKAKIFFPENYFQHCYNPHELSFDQLKNRAHKLNKNLDFREVAKGALKFFDEQFKRDPSKEPLEKSIFENFVTPAETNFINQYNDLNWQDRWKFTQQNGILDQNNRIVRMGKKSILEYDINLAPLESQERYRRYCEKRLFNLDNNQEDLDYITISTVIDQLNVLKRDNPSEISHIKELENYFDRRLAVKFK